MPDTVKEGDKKEDLSLLEKADKKESEVKKEESEIYQGYRGEYRGLAEYIGFTENQRKRVASVVSWCIVIGFPFLMLGVVLFFASFFVEPISLFESPSSTVEKYYERTNQEGFTDKDSQNSEKATR